jgi:hypothetical protein
MHHRHPTSRAAAWLVAAALLLAGSSASAGSRTGEVAEEVGLGLAAATCTVLYLPAKVFIAATGLLTSGAAWGVTGGDREPALEILERTGGGDWIVTQQHLRGDRRFYVLARDPRPDVARRD